MSMPEMGQGYANMGSANLLVYPEDEVARLLNLSTTGYIEMEENMYRYTLLSWMNNRLC